MFSISTAPPRLAKLSYDEFAAPSALAVAAWPNSALPGTPNRVSVPSIGAPTACTTVPCATDVAATITATPTTNRVAAAVNSAHPCFLSRTMTPNVRRNATGMTSIATISTTLERGVGFSNGCALFTLNAPPPSPDISLIDSHAATGPPRIVWLPPDSVDMFCALLKLLTTPRATKISVTTIERGSRMRTTERTIDPEVPELFILVLRKPPNQRNRDAHSHCATSERLHTETGGQPDMA